MGCGRDCELAIGSAGVVQDFNTMTPPHDHYYADSGTKLRHFHKMIFAVATLFWLHFSMLEAETRRPSFITFYRRNTLRGDLHLLAYS